VSDKEIKDINTDDNNNNDSNSNSFGTPMTSYFSSDSINSFGKPMILNESGKDNLEK